MAQEELGGGLTTTEKEVEASGVQGTVQQKEEEEEGSGEKEENGSGDKEEQEEDGSGREQTAKAEEKKTEKKQPLFGSSGTRCKSECKPKKTGPNTVNEAMKSESYEY